MDKPTIVASVAIAIAYFEAGWHPLWLPPGAKEPPPKNPSRTGYEGVDLTLEEIQAANWSGNIGSRMPVDVIGLDIDAYKGGLQTFNDLRAQLGPLPPTFISHSGRNDGSGIRFYRVPIMVWVFTLPGIDIIQRGHRYACLYPSMHPDGRQYGWWDQAEQAPMDTIPRVEDLPDLPWSWIAELSRPNQQSLTARSTAADRIGTIAFLTTHETAEAPGYLTVITGHFYDHWQDGYSRHDTMQHCLIWALEMARAGVLSAPEAVKHLGTCWVNAVDPDARRMEIESDRRVTEFEAMLRHAVGKVAAKTQAEIDKLHDDYAGIRMNTPVTDHTEEVLGVEQPPPIITFRSLPDPFTVPSIEWLAEDLLCNQTHGELAGAEKSLKSYLGLIIDVGLAAGLDVLGRFKVTTRHRVSLLIGEGGEGPFLRRLAEVCHGYGIAPGDLQDWLRYTTDHARINSPRFLDGITRELETFGPALIHGDPWYTYQPATTDSAQLVSVGLALDAYAATCTTHGAVAWLNHHFNRTDQSGLRQITGAGHAEWVDSWMLSAHRDTPDLINGNYKLRLDVGSRQWGGNAYDVDLDIQPTLGILKWNVSNAPVGTLPTNDPLVQVKLELTRIGNQIGQPMTKAVWTGHVGKRRQVASAAFDDMVAKGYILKNGTVMNGTRTVDLFELA